MKAEHQQPFQWKRDWQTYFVQSVLAQDTTKSEWPVVSEDERKLYENNVMPGWSGYILQLNNPILCHTKLCPVISGRNFRIYPPFLLNKKSGITHTFDDVAVPCSSTSVEIPRFAVKGVLAEQRPFGASPAYGLRVDCENDIALGTLVQNFLLIVRQYTKQWWISSARDPFDLGLRMSFELQKGFIPRDILLAKALGEAKATWFGTVSTQGLTGLELPLNQNLWIEISRAMNHGQAIEQGIQLFLDAVEEYMNFRDQKCILDLALLFEICENKVLIMNSHKTKSKNKDILNQPNIADREMIATFKKIIVDRDNIAHGRKPVHYSRDSKIITIYLSIAANFLNKYLDKCRQFGWERVLQISL